MGWPLLALHLSSLGDGSDLVFGCTRIESDGLVAVLSLRIVRLVLRRSVSVIKALMDVRLSFRSVLCLRMTVSSHEASVNLGVVDFLALVTTIFTGASRCLAQLVPCWLASAAPMIANPECADFTS